VSRIESEALVVRTVELGESDVVATLVTEQAGKVGAIVRGARKGSRRVGGALEPVHTIAVLLEDRGGELATLKESRIVRTRGALVANLEALDAAGIALRWARHLFPPRTPEPEGWSVLVELLDVLDAGSARSQESETEANPRSGAEVRAGGVPPEHQRAEHQRSVAPRTELARAGLALLAAVGYALDLERCVVCGRPCPEGKAACVDPARGGLVCRACGGASTVLLPAVRDAARALAEGASAEVTAEQAESLLQLVDRAMAAHAGFER
jgi:DNA repair protein RecO (recombination protein O)